MHNNITNTQCTVYSVINRFISVKSTSRAARLRNYSSVDAIHKIHGFYRRKQFLTSCVVLFFIHIFTLALIALFLLFNHSFI